MAALFLLLAIAAALGVVVGLLLVASAGTTKTRRRDQRVRHPGEFASPAELESTASAASTAERRGTVPSQLAERPSEPLYEEAKRAARLRSDQDLLLLSTDDRARFWQTGEHARRS